jgi:hypothetical protein
LNDRGPAIASVAYAAVVARPVLPSRLSRYWPIEVISGSTLPSKKWLAPGMTFCSMMMPYGISSFSSG